MADMETEAQALEAEAAKLAGEATAQEGATDALVDQWLADYFPPSFITRDSAAWQHITAAATELKRRLKG